MKQKVLSVDRSLSVHLNQKYNLTISVCPSQDKNPFSSTLMPVERSGDELIAPSFINSNSLGDHVFLRTSPMGHVILMVSMALLFCALFLA